MSEKTHYRKAFNSPYLSSADIVEPINLTISHVLLGKDETKKSKDLFNTAYFVEKQLRDGEPLKPMILNATNCKTLSKICNSKFIDDWQNVRVTVFVDKDVRFGRDTVEGLRIHPKQPTNQKPTVTPDNKNLWAGAISAYKRDGDFSKVLEKADISEQHQKQIIAECSNDSKTA